jgi:hypothetical protein
MNKKCFCLLSVFAVGMCFGNEALLREGVEKRFCETGGAIVKVRLPARGKYTLLPIGVGVEYKPSRLAVSEELDDFYNWIERLSTARVPFALYCDGFEDITVEQVGIMLDRSQNGNMKELRLLGAGNYLKGIDVDVAFINRIPESVVDFRIANNFQIDDACIIRLSERLPNLEVLYLWNTEKVTDKALRRGIANCRNLQRLTLSLCRKVSSGGLKYLPKELDYLEIVGYSLVNHTVEDLARALSRIRPTRVVTSVSKSLKKEDIEKLQNSGITVEVVAYC